MNQQIMNEQTVNQQTLNQQTVHIIFKSHLDIGFTGFARTVRDQYLYDYIPRALDLINETASTDMSFVWTTGSWVINEYLETMKGAALRRMEKALAQRSIRWHALPCTLHSELTTPQLFREGLEISKDLDRRFGIRTIAGKFTDVPGHTLGIVPLLAEYGVTFLHIGINPACTPADVPPLFRWRSPDGSEVIINYHAGYGNTTDFPPAGAVLWFSHQQDNERPPTAASLQSLKYRLMQQYPSATIAASSLDDFARLVEPFKGQLPVVDKEIGDTWIHGAATDPLKVSRYRALCRFSNSRVPPDSREMKNFRRKLLLVPEHTWGMDLKTFLPDYLHYGKESFQKARKADTIPPEVLYEGAKTCLPQTGSSLTRLPTTAAALTYSQFEASWKEQRDYIDQSLNCLQDSRLFREAASFLAEASPAWVDTDKFTKLPAAHAGPFRLGAWELGIDLTSGAVCSLKHLPSDVQLCVPNSGHAIGLYRYEVFSHKEYQQFYERFIVQEETHCDWSLPDYTKPGLQNVRDLAYQQFLPQSPTVYLADEGLFIYAELPEQAWREYGAPREILSRFSVTPEADTLMLTFFWRYKDASRIPEASWLEFSFNTDSIQGCLIDKMGMWITPDQVVENGNRAMHAIGSGIACAVGDGRYRLDIASQDAPLVSIGRPRILAFDQQMPDCREGMFFNLHNNLWGTNFPMWYSDDAVFTFIISLSDWKN
jgi:hypothetical protein